MDNQNTSVPSSASFAEFNLPSQIQAALKRANFTSATPIQQASLPLALAGKDLIASAETGSGKTAAFVLPMLVHLLSKPQSRALVLAPTRELAEQIRASVYALSDKRDNLGVALLIGGASMSAQIMSLKKGARVIVATPGRLVDHMQRFSGLLRGVNFLVLDEADRMLDMGFAPQLKLVRQSIEGERQTLLFSATLPRDIQELCQEWLKDPARVAIGSTSRPVDRIAQTVKHLDSAEKDAATLAHLNSNTGSVIIFARTKRRTDKLAQFLQTKGVKACRIHGDRTQGQRREALQGFRAGQYRVLVATDIAARGLDVPHIEHVLNYDLPMVAEDYLHRIGRTARAGKSGQALCFVAPEEKPLWRAIERIMKSERGMTAKESREMAEQSLKEFKKSTKSKWPGDRRRGPGREGRGRNSRNAPAGGRGYRSNFGEGSRRSAAN